MKTLNEDYARYFNKRWGRVGHLFQGRFKSKPVVRRSHALQLTRYIVLNPVRGGIVENAADFEWSNYRATAGLSEAPPWLDVNWTLSELDPRNRDVARDLYKDWVEQGKTITTADFHFLELVHLVCHTFGVTEEALRLKKGTKARKALAQLGQLNMVKKWLGVTPWAVRKMAQAGEYLELEDFLYQSALAQIRNALGLK